MNDYAFGNFLYTLRSEKGLSQSQLGEILGVTNKAVSKWENGTAKPNTILIPRIAEVFDVTVEELFAGKRLEKDNEYEKVKEYLSYQKRKYAILSSVFLSIVLIIPLLLIEFIVVVMGFSIPDDVVGPLGSVGFIFAFIISVTAYVIYRKNFKQTLTPTETVCTSRFVNAIKNGFLFSLLAWWYIVAPLLMVYMLILSFSKGFKGPTIFLLSAIFVSIIFLGMFICFLNIKRLLKIRFSKQPQKEKKRIRFSEFPIWMKICYFVFIFLFPITINIQISTFLEGSGLFIRLFSLFIYFGCLLVLIFYNAKKK